MGKKKSTSRNGENSHPNLDEVIAKIKEPEMVRKMLELLLSFDEIKQSEKRWRVLRELLKRGEGKSPSGVEIAQRTGTDANYVSRRTTHLKRLNSSEVLELRKICGLDGI